MTHKFTPCADTRKSGRLPHSWFRCFRTRKRRWGSCYWRRWRVDEIHAQVWSSSMALISFQSVDRRVHECRNKTRKSREEISHAHHRSLPTFPRWALALLRMHLLQERWWRSTSWANTEQLAPILTRNLNMSCSRRGKQPSIARSALNHMKRSLRLPIPKERRHISPTTNTIDEQ